MGIVTFDTEQGARQIYEGGFEVTAEGNILLLDGSETSIPSSRVVGWKAQDRVIPGMPIDIVVGVFDDELEQNHQLLG